MKLFLISFIVFIIAFQADAQLSPLPNSTSERWHDKVPVSGEIRTGLMMADLCTEKVKNSFYVKIPLAHGFKFLNVDISSNDGRYSYTSHYNIENKHGVIELLRESKLTKKLQNYQCNDLAILSWMSVDVKDQKKEFVLSNWESDFESKNAIIYLNSENPALLFIKDNSTNESKTISCRTIEKEANVAYNCFCELPVKNITKDAEISIVQRVRRSQNRYLMKINQ